MATEITEEVTREELSPFTGPGYGFLVTAKTEHIAEKSVSLWLCVKEWLMPEDDGDIDQPGVVITRKGQRFIYPFCEDFKGDE